MPYIVLLPINTILYDRALELILKWHNEFLEVMDMFSTLIAVMHFSTGIFKMCVYVYTHTHTHIHITYTYIHITGAYAYVQAHMYI